MNKNIKVWICQDCSFIFQTYSRDPAARNTFFCPNCGENISVRRYRVQKKKKRENRTYRIWTDEELAVIKQVLDGELMIYQAAMKLGRSNKSVRGRLDRIKEEVTAK